MRLAALALLLAGCSFLPDHDTTPIHVTIQTDRTQYTAQREPGTQRYGFTLVTRIENRNRHWVYLARCRPDDLHPIYGIELIEPADDGGAAYNTAWACAGHDHPIAIRPRGARTDTLHLVGPNAWSGGTPLGRLEGRFRLYYDVSRCRDEVGCPLPDSLRRSNAFDVQLTP
ncbi:MAG: hypothetical protein R2834_02575 [Rhodothermales bacterium]